VAASDAGLVLRLEVAPAGRVVTTTLDGGADDGARLDRLAREAFAEDTLRGTLRVRGMAGDAVMLDGRRRGHLGQDGERVFPRVREGRHAVRVTRPASAQGTLYEPFSREVDVRHADETVLKVTLLPKESTAALGAEPVGPALPVGALLTTAGGAALLSGGVVCGVLSLQDAAEVERRARDQQLVFPRDADFVARGRTLAVAANVLYGAGAVAVGGGIAWWVVASTPGPDEEDTP